MLPPYSPDLNPIEETFHALKAFIRKNQATARVFGDDYQGFLWWAIHHFMEGKNEYGYFKNAFIAVDDDNL